MRFTPENSHCPPFPEHPFWSSPENPLLLHLPDNTQCIFQSRLNYNVTGHRMAEIKRQRLQSAGKEVEPSYTSTFIYCPWWYKLEPPLWKTGSVYSSWTYQKNQQFELLRYRLNRNAYIFSLKHMYYNFITTIFFKILFIYDKER